MFREKHLTWSGDPFSTYENFLRLPSPNAAYGKSGETVTNLMEYVLDRSGDMRFRFDLRNRVHVSAFAQWFAEHAPTIGIAESLWHVA